MIWITPGAGLLAGFCIFFSVFGGLTGGYLTMFINFKLGLPGGVSMLGFGVFLIVCLLVVVVLLVSTYKRR